MMNNLDGIGMLLDAVKFSAEKHRSQKRKDEVTPYINHPIAVAHKLKHVGSVDDVIVLCSAILHDTIEDTDTTKEELAERFGDDVAEIVAEVTDDLELKIDKSQDGNRKQQEIDHAPFLSERAKLVKMADKICNIEDLLHSPPAWSPERRMGYFDFANQIIDGLRGTNRALEDAFDVLYATRQ
jgi:guanosine-3',5'-bis(diphosphate) 3'-pyrophosphohydrolase